MASQNRRRLCKMLSAAALFGPGLTPLCAREYRLPGGETLHAGPLFRAVRSRVLLAPTGKLRASINVGNPVLARLDPASGQPVGVSVDLALALAKELQMSAEFQVFDAAQKSVEAVAREQADIGFFAIDPLRSAQIAFTAPYVLISGNYLVRSDSTIQTNDCVDRPGVRVAVGQGSAYDLYLTRHLRHAELVRMPTSREVVDAFLVQKLDVAAGVKQQLEADARRVSSVRLLPESFMLIEQAMGLPRARGAAAAEMLHGFLEARKADGFIARSLSRHGIDGASLAPPARHKEAS